MVKAFFAAALFAAVALVAVPVAQAPPDIAATITTNLTSIDLNFAGVLLVVFAAIAVGVGLAAVGATLFSTAVNSMHGSQGAPEHRAGTSRFYEPG